MYPSFSVFYFDINIDIMKSVDLFKCEAARLLEIYKSNKTINLKSFKESILRYFMSKYWSRYEYEMCIFKYDEKFVFYPLFRSELEYSVDADEWIQKHYNKTAIEFFMYILKRRGYKDANIRLRNSIKVDVYDQILFAIEKFDDSVEKLWEFFENNEYCFSEENNDEIFEKNNHEIIEENNDKIIEDKKETERQYEGNSFYTFDNFRIIQIEEERFEVVMLDYNTLLGELYYKDESMKFTSRNDDCLNLMTKEFFEWLVVWSKMKVLEFKFRSERH